MKSNSNNVTILICSCDRYSDTWYPVATSFQKYWPDCPYPIALISNTKSFEKLPVRNYKVGSDEGWATNLINALTLIDSAYVLLWLDDVFIKKPVISKNIKRDIEWAIENSIDYLSLRPLIFNQGRSKKDYELIDSTEPYRASIFASFWNVKTLKAILIPGENPWQFEFRGSKRSKSYDKFFTVCSPRFEYVHAIEKGKWINSAVIWAEKQGWKIDLDLRSKMTKSETALFYLSRVKGWCLSNIESKKRTAVLKAIKVFYLKIGLRDNEYYRDQ